MGSGTGLSHCPNCHNKIDEAKGMCAHCNLKLSRFGLIPYQANNPNKKFNKKYKKARSKKATGYTGKGGPLNELKKMVSFDDRDLEANRQGKFSGRQRTRQRQFLALYTAGIGLSMGVIGCSFSWPNQNSIYLTVFSVFVIVLCGWKAFTTWLEFYFAKVLAYQSSGKKHWEEKMGKRGMVHMINYFDADTPEKKSFEVNEFAYAALRPDWNYIIYATSFGRLLSIEPTGRVNKNPKNGEGKNTIYPTRLKHCGISLRGRG